MRLEVKSSRLVVGVDGLDSVYAKSALSLLIATQRGSSFGSGVSSVWGLDDEDNKPELRVK